MKFEIFSKRCLDHFIVWVPNRVDVWDAKKLNFNVFVKLSGLVSLSWQLISEGSNIISGIVDFTVCLSNKGTLIWIMNYFTFGIVAMISNRSDHCLVVCTSIVLKSDFALTWPVDCAEFSRLVFVRICQCWHPWSRSEFRTPNQVIVGHPRWNNQHFRISCANFPISIV